MADAVEAARTERGVAHVALAGGTSPRRAYELFAALVADFDDIHLWFGDERAVGADDPLANYRMAASVLPAARLHRIPGERGAAAAAAAYADELAASVAPSDGLPVLDLVVLGLGTDGHTASLFPGSPALSATGSCVAVADAPFPPPDRITLTLPMLRAARARLILASGHAKAQPVAVLLAGPDPAVPASLTGNRATELLIDEAAAGALAPSERSPSTRAPEAPRACR
jgi:6-phosphogluconolactonase